MATDRQHAEHKSPKGAAAPYCTSLSDVISEPIPSSNISRNTSDPRNNEKNDDIELNVHPHGTEFPEGGVTGWLVVFGSFCAMGVIYGLINTSGVFETYLKQNQLKEYTHTKIGWIFSVNLFLVFFVGIQVGPIFDRYGPRLLVAAGSILVVLSMMLLSLSNEYYQIILSYSVLGGLGAALLNAPAYGAIAHYFDKKRGFATGIATTAGGICGIVFPLLLQSLLGENGPGFPWTCRIMGFILLGLCLPANLFIRSRKNFRSQREDISSGSIFPDLSIFRDSRFALAAASYFFLEWGLFVPVTYIVSYGASHGLGFSEASILLSIFNASSVVGRFVPGFLADHFGRFNLIITTTCLCSVSVIGIWLPAASSKPVFTAFCVIFGFASGSNLSLVPVCLGQICELQDYARYYSTAAMIASFGTLSSVPLAGAILGAGSERIGWISLILLSGLAYFAACLCYTLARAKAIGWKPLAKF